jgi:hypothetical protein
MLAKILVLESHKPKKLRDSTFLKLVGRSQVLVAHACNPNYSGGRDQEVLGLKPAQANSFRDPILKIPITKRAGGVA